ncbi:uncharacterized protein BDR25DRAFT_358192 [Lindgomyces ingoldianus]|uniref:Uncharacterized protein n=1 Tax=Lindgomyces ingoldianus TaxID=673940 RepID=A0ACB6QM47_9PLEO|nr:uncharacterized protein BDR25DRAFT_358192 [Lindgomyces ingoldianus]KAF2467942.1 hypothetical protein BDR25DRAFT_358192 [Lindgomyces ingoldianus]
MSSSASITSSRLLHVRRDIRLYRVPNRGHSARIKLALYLGSSFFLESPSDTASQRITVEKDKGVLEKYKGYDAGNWGRFSRWEPFCGKYKTLTRFVDVVEVNARPFSNIANDFHRQRFQRGSTVRLSALEACTGEILLTFYHFIVGFQRGVVLYDWAILRPVRVRFCVRSYDREEESSTIRLKYAVLQSKQLRL